MSKELKRIVKEIQYSKDWTVEQVASSIGYSRVHLMREMKKEGRSELEKILKEKHPKTLQNVSFPEPEKTNGDMGNIIRGLTEDRIRLEAAVNILTISLADVIARQTGLTIGVVSSELQKAISSESDRLLSERGKKA